MGNQCCSSCKSSFQSQSSPINTQSSTPPNISKKPSYIDSQGVPVSNAYKRYVKPPSTIGRQSIIVRNLHDNENIPEWIWAAQNQNILNSCTQHNTPQVEPFVRPYGHLRHTYEPIEGRFKGIETVNLSKLQNKPLISSENQINRIFSNNDPLHGHYSVQSNSFTKSGFENIHTTQSVNSNTKPTFSFHDVPVATSINMNKSQTQMDMKITESKNVPMSPFQMITQGQNDRNQFASGTKMVESNAPRIQSAFKSNVPSVNNLIKKQSMS